MLDQPLNCKAAGAGSASPAGATPLTVPDLDAGLAQLLTPLGPAMVALYCRVHQGGRQTIVRFRNGYGALISSYRILEGIYEIAPLRFHGSGPEDYELYFRSHVPDLTWCSDGGDMVGVGEEIARLAPAVTV
jgi:hypothetical protein